MKTIFYEAASRGYAKHGWLTTHHSFSFASYFDPARMGFGMLRVLNDDAIAPGSGFGRHPHDNMEIITIPLLGALAHEDSMGQPAGATPTALLAGNKATIKTGEVQVMSAGTGVEHAEFNASDTEPVELLQIWILSDEENVEPRYDQRSFDSTEYHNTFFQVVGKLGLYKGLGIHQDARLSLGRFDAGEKITYKLQSEKHGVYFFVIEGEVSITDTKMTTRDALGVWDTEEIGIQVEKEAFLLAIEVPMA